MFGDGSPAKQAIRDQLKKKLQTNCRCDLVPPIRENLNDPMVLRSSLKRTKERLEQYRLARASKRRDGWHRWLAEQKADGNKNVFAWIRREEAAWAPCPFSKQEQLDEAELAW